MRKRTVALILLLSLIFLPLSAEITASYEPTSPLEFTKGSPPFSPTNFIAHLGRLTITATAGETLYQPSLVDANISTRFEFTGPVTWWSQNGVPVYNNQSTGFFFGAVVTELGVTSFHTLSPGGGTSPMTITQKDLGVSVFVAELYLLGDQPSSIYKPGALYTMNNSNSLGSFNVAIAANDQGIYYMYVPKIYVPFPGQTIIPGGAPPLNSPTVAPPGIRALPYGNGGDQQVLQYLLSIINEPPIHLPDAYETRKIKVAQANIRLENATAGKDYQVDIKFTSTSVSPAYQGKFHLHLDGKLSRYGIAYDLFFNGNYVTPGVPIRWEGIQTTQNRQKDIQMTGVIQDVAERAPSGTYSDTITVNITPVDTI